MSWVTNRLRDQSNRCHSWGCERSEPTVWRRAQWAPHHAHSLRSLRCGRPHVVSRSEGTERRYGAKGGGMGPHSPRYASLRHPNERNGMKRSGGDGASVARSSLPHIPSSPAPRGAKWRVGSGGGRGSLRSRSVRYARYPSFRSEERTKRRMGGCPVLTTYR